MPSPPTSFSEWVDLLWIRSEPWGGRWKCQGGKYSAIYADIRIRMAIPNFNPSKLGNESSPLSILVSDSGFLCSAFYLSVVGQIVPV